MQFFFNLGSNKVDFETILFFSKDPKLLEKTSNKLLYSKIPASVSGLTFLTVY